MRENEKRKDNKPLVLKCSLFYEGTHFEDETKLKIPFKNKTP